MMIEQFRIKFPKKKAHAFDQNEEYFFLMEPEDKERPAIESQE